MRLFALLRTRCGCEQSMLISAQNFPEVLYRAMFDYRPTQVTPHYVAVSNTANTPHRAFRFYTRTGPQSALYLEDQECH